jgi:signal transduction histidine kinase
MTLQELLTLQSIDLFADLSEDELRCDVTGETVFYPQGETMWHEGDPARYFMIVLEGSFEIYRIIKGRRLFISRFTAGMTGGELPLLAGTPHPGNAYAITDVRLFRIAENSFWRLLGECESVRRKILANMADRLQEMNLLSFQREKMYSLGTMAAGLAHELNNPAAAAKRASQNLIRTLDAFDRHSSGMLKSVVFKNPPPEEQPFQPLFDVLNPEGVHLDPLTRNDYEDDLIAWMEELDISDAWDVAPAMVAAGYTRDMLEEFSRQLKPEHVTNFIRWMQKEVEMRVLVTELKESVTRISDLVLAIKAYSYMDQDAQKIKIDVHEGIRNTLIILKHKLRKKNIRISMEFSEQIPRIDAHGSELNQVWTNLLDNAIDAVPETGGEITIKTYLSDECAETPTVAVEIIDNGTGIPREIQGRIFEPFFTTKEVGKGTGIGLEISHRIVVGQHKGDIEVYSEPGRTQFIVYLPVEWKQ